MLPCHFRLNFVLWDPFIEIYDEDIWLLFSSLIAHSKFDEVQITLFLDPEINLSAIVYKGLAGTDTHCPPKGKYVVITVST